MTVNKNQKLTFKDQSKKESEKVLRKLQAHLVWLGFALLHFTGIVLSTNEGKTLHQQKKYDSIYCDIYFIVVV